MGDGDNSPVTGDFFHGILDEAFCDRIDIARCLVKNEDFGIGDNGSCEGDQLSFTGGERGCPLGDIGVKALFEFVYEMIHMHVLGGLYCLFS